MRALIGIGLAALLAVTTVSAEGSCHGKMINPITDMDWSSIFPITIGGVKVAKGRLPDAPGNPSSPVCACSDPVPRAGITVGFWEPIRLVDVTRTPFCFVNLGGVTLMSGGSQGQGGPSTAGDKNESQYHLHWYVYPVLHLLEVIIDGVCLDKSDFDVAYITEFDPTWQNESLAFILTPEAALFGNLAAQVACAADATAASAYTALDPLFWCAGGQGSVYPLTSFTPHHYGGVSSSVLLLERMTFKMHRELLLWGSMGEQGLCGKYPMPIWRKSQYRYQMVYPQRSKAQPYGRPTILWESGKEYPVKGEDFGYVVWRKRNCCAF
jgi:conjugal transfer pilus assembly protein TraU